MKYIDEFRNKKLIQEVLFRVREITPSGQVNIMEVCGTHTQSFFRFGLDKLLPQNLRLISGPGCPVCVSSQGYIDAAIKLAKLKDVILLTFGDMLRILGSHSTLEKEKAKSGNVRVVYSPLDTLKIARDNPAKKIIFLAVGFETTAPAIALSILAAKEENLRNLFFFSSLKLIPPAMDYLVRDERLNLSGFLCPGHVSAIIGTKAYAFIPRKYGLPCCISGFEPLDILEGIYLILRQIQRQKPEVANQYSRVVQKNGNLKAQKVIQSVFKISDAYWRGFGKISQSGLAIKDACLRFDAAKNFSLRRDNETTRQRETQCRCGEVLKGLILPPECPLFLKACSPDNPVGPCMVSSEGACNAYYKYGKK